LSTSKKTWISYLREEVDASYLYEELAQRTSDPKDKKNYVSLSDIEKKTRTDLGKIAERGRG